MDVKKRFNNMYKNSPDIFGEQPVLLVKKASSFLHGGFALELGVGNGRNIKFLLTRSFDVTGVDLSEEGIKILKKRIKDDNNLHLYISDVRSFKPNRQYDIILAIGLLHFFEKSQMEAIIENMKNWTVKGGINVIAARMSQNYLKDLPFIFSSKELKTYYQNKNWEIKEYKEIEKADRKIAALITKKLI
jgi:tellurite methyltransferase